MWPADELLDSLYRRHRQSGQHRRFLLPSITVARLLTIAPPGAPSCQGHSGCRADSMDRLINGSPARTRSPSGTSTWTPRGSADSRGSAPGSSGTWQSSTDDSAHWPSGFTEDPYGSSHSLPVPRHGEAGRTWATLRPANGIHPEARHADDFVRRGASRSTRASLLAVPPAGRARRGRRISSETVPWTWRQTSTSSSAR